MNTELAEKPGMWEVAQQEVDEKKIVLKAAWGKTQGACRVYPVPNRNGGFHGVKPLTEEEKRNAPFVITGKHNTLLEDGKEFDLTDPYQAAVWNYVKHQEDVCMSFEESQSNPSATFYVHSDDKEAAARVSKALKIGMAIELIAVSSQPKWYDYARVLSGNDMTNQPPLEVQEYLLKECQDHPERVLDKLKNKLFNVRVFVYKAIDKKIIKRRDDETYYFGDQTFGTSTNDIVEFVLEDRGHNQLVTQEIRSLLMPKGSKVADLSVFEIDSTTERSTTNKSHLDGPISGTVRPDSSRPGDFDSVETDEERASTTLDPHSHSELDESEDVIGETDSQANARYAKSDSEAKPKAARPAPGRPGPKK